MTAARRWARGARVVVPSGLVALLAGGGEPARAQATARTPLTLWYPAPAREWVEALPVGNGRLGATIDITFSRPSTRA